MLAVRCDACGMKALVAASQCPHCGHLLDIRDSFGEILPLVHCDTCDASYLRRDGACKWCGSTPDKVNYRPYIWKAAGGLAFMGMAVGAFLTRDVEEPAEPAAVSSVVASTESLVAAPPPVERAVATDTVPLQPVLSESTATPDSAAIVAVTDSATRPAIAAPPVAIDTAPASLPETAAVGQIAVENTTPPPVVAPRKPVVRKAPPPPRRSARWTSAVVVSWVTVRAAPSRGARLVGSVGPDSHVQLGEARGDWRRIRMRGIVGWVKDGRFASPRRVAAKRRAAP